MEISVGITFCICGRRSKSMWNYCKKEYCNHIYAEVIVWGRLISDKQDLHLGPRKLFLCMHACKIKDKIGQEWILKPINCTDLKMPLFQLIDWCIIVNGKNCHDEVHPLGLYRRHLMTRLFAIAVASSVLYACLMLFLFRMGGNN